MVLFLEKKLSIWLENEGKRAKGQESFRRQHPTTDHLVTLRIIVEECRNDKSNLFCCFVDFRKDFDMVPRNNLWNRLEELKVPVGVGSRSYRRSCYFWWTDSFGGNRRSGATTP